MRQGISNMLIASNFHEYFLSGELGISRAVENEKLELSVTSSEARVCIGINCGQKLD